MIIKKVIVNVYINTDSEDIANDVIKNCDYGFNSNTENVKIINTEIVEWS